MRLTYTGSVQLAEMAAAFPYQVQPVFATTDYATNLTPNSTFDFQSLKVESLLGCAMTEPLFIPHCQVNTAGATIVDDGAYIRTGFPVVNWSTITLSGPGGIQAFSYRPWGHQYFDVLCTDETQAANMSLTAQVDGSFSAAGMTVILTRNHFGRVDGSTTASSWEVRFNVGANNLYSLLGGSGQYVQLRLSTDNGSTFKVLNGKLKPSTNPLSFLGNATPNEGGTPIVIEALAYAGSLMISLGGQSAPYIVELPAQGSTNGPIPAAIAYPKITAVKVMASNFTQFSWQVHPTKFATTGQYTSMVSQIGFTPDPSTPMYAHVTLLQQAYTLYTGDSQSEGGGSLQWNWLPDGSTSQYQVILSNPQTGTYNGTGYADASIAFTRITTRIDGLSRVNPYTASSVIPKEVKEVITFDLNRLSIDHALDITLDNWKGIDFLQQAIGLRGYGNIGVSMRLGWAHMGPSPVDGLPGFQHFYGYCDTYDYTQPDDNHAFLTLHCLDQMQWLKDQLIAAPPDMDGWNHYYAMFYLAQRAGITPAQMGFLAMVPDDPFSSAPFDPNPYFLPFGNGMHPWTPRDRTLPIMDLMQYIRKATGFVLFMDAYGLLRYEPLIPPADVPVTKVYRATADYGYGQGGGQFNEIASLMLRNSTKDTRNQVVVIGIDAYSADWSPIVQKREDSASIYTAMGDTPPQNYCGYPKPFIWMDSRFANQGFASAAADNIFAILRLPDQQVRLESAWLQPEVFPMQVIQVDYPRANSLGVNFYVLSVVNILSVMGNQLTLKSYIGGKFLL